MRAPDVITPNRKAKLLAKAPQIATEQQLTNILATFPEPERAALREQVKPLLHFTLNEPIPAITRKDVPVKPAAPKTVTVAKAPHKKAKVKK